MVAHSNEESSRHRRHLVTRGVGLRVVAGPSNEETSRHRRHLVTRGSFWASLSRAAMRKQPSPSSPRHPRVGWLSMSRAAMRKAAVTVVTVVTRGSWLSLSRSNEENSRHRRHRRHRRHPRVGLSVPLSQQSGKQPSPSSPRHPRVGLVVDVAQQSGKQPSPSSPFVTRGVAQPKPRQITKSIPAPFFSVQRYLAAGNRSVPAAQCGRATDCERISGIHTTRSVRTASYQSLRHRRPIPEPSETRTRNMLTRSASDGSGGGEQGCRSRLVNRRSAESRKTLRHRQLRHRRPVQALG